MTEFVDRRGVLYPAALPTFRRIPAPADLREQIRWFWLPRWHLAPGRTSRQHLLPFPASNLVVQSGWSGDAASGDAAPVVSIAGPSTRATHRDLHGDGWAVGVLLRPAGVAGLGVEPRQLRDSETVFDAPDLLAAVTSAMADPDADHAAEQASSRFADWLRRTLPEPDVAARQANTLEDLVATDRTIHRVDNLADRLSTSTRSVQRTADRYIGLTPLAIIRRYRLQDAADRLRTDPDVTIAAVAADVGYADQSHFSADFKRTLGFPPSRYSA
ncbi:MAG: helix-turn-helix domain-containing protein [Gordonia sp. (in: high G+C Gram-positive bacteria)]